MYLFGRTSVVAALAVVAVCSIGNAQQFVMQCNPLGSAATHPAIDNTCPIGGSSSPGSAEYKQNKVKNNFCASNSVKDITINQLADMQANTNQILRDRGQQDGEPPTDRSIFGAQAVGSSHEGDLVRLTGYVFEAHTADFEETGESVNCGWGLNSKSKNVAPNATVAKIHNDIHIALVATKSDDECSSVTAEISPHMRPAKWTETTVGGLKGKWVRVTGQLMYDGNHLVCAGGVAASGSPARQSKWEVHPVYKLEVCESGSCTDAQWKPL